jgi:hypothetical protein
MNLAHIWLCQSSDLYTSFTSSKARAPKQRLHTSPPLHTVLQTAIKMLSLFRTIMSLVLIAVFSAGSLELRIVAATLVPWAVGLVLHRRLSLSPTFLQRHRLFMFMSSVVLVATNTLFYENTAGRCLDFFFTRASYDPDTPGSGFTDIYDTFARRHRHDIEFTWDYLRFAFWSAFAFVSLPFVVAGIHCYAKLPARQPGLTDAIEHLDRTGEYPPWLLMTQVQAFEPKPKRNIRYMHLSDDIIFVCGLGGGFGQVVAGDYEGAISRRRGLSKEFA